MRIVSIPILRLLFSFDVTGRENIPRHGNYVVIANHLNWLDEFTLLWLMPIEPRLHFLADPTLLVTRKFQWWMVRTTGGYVPVVRERHGDQVLFHHVDRALEIGGAVGIFPEANYGPKEGELLPFHKGFAHFAIKAGVQVVPVALSGTKELWLRKRIKVVIGKPLSTAGKDPNALTAEAFGALKSILPPYSEPQGRKLFRKQLTHLF
ncbi:MAG TPA: 1-acyl-sn-glycerol-3-phosphate acyltransferase [Candidatus Dormibacteraeota bacterium]|nr:1-acyl-sn-glycerol-3-phosphate acyltransferase [Candidatus Dormibacteraeota bacterium]